MGEGGTLRFHAGRGQRVREGGRERGSRSMPMSHSGLTI